MAYRLLPVKAENTDGQIGRVNTEIMYDNMMNKFQWGNLELPGVYLDETNTRMTMNFRNNYGRLANALIDEGEKEKAIQVLNRCMQVMPEEKFPFNYFIMPIAEAYYKADEIEKANAITSSLLETYEVELAYFFSFSPKKRASIDDDIQQALAVVQRVQRVAEFYKQTELAKQANTVFMNYYQLYTGMQIPQQQMQQPELPVAAEDETIAITE
jgi:tetratricopeptide (TPR) repeat protein